MKAALLITAPDPAKFAEVRESLRQFEVSDQIAGATSIDVECESDPLLTLAGYVVVPGPFVERWYEVIYDSAAGMWLEESKTWD